MIRRTLLVLALGAGLTFIAPRLQAQTSEEPVATEALVHPRIVNLALKYAASNWTFTLGQAYQKYGDGSIKVMATDKEDTYMLEVDNVCIILILEDDID